MREKVSRVTDLHFERANFKLLMELLSRSPWESAFEGLGLHECCSAFKKSPFSSTGAGNSTVLWVKQMGQKISLAEQGTPLGAQKEKEIGQSLEVRSDFEGRLQTQGLHIQRKHMKDWILNRYLPKMVTWQTGMKTKRKHSIYFLLQCLVLIILTDLGLPSPLNQRNMSAETVIFHLWILKLWGIVNVSAECS